MDLSAVPAVIVICLLLVAEEAGVPIPLAQGEVVLIGSGLLVASGRVGLPEMMVLTALAAAAGAFAGYGWAGLVGASRLTRVASVLHAEGAFTQATARLRGANVALVAVTRLVPGLRVYTSLVAGGSRIGVRRFAAALALAIPPWVVFYTLLGVFVGVPAEHLIGRVEGTALRLGAVVLIIFVAYLAVRRLPAARSGSAPTGKGPLRVLAALGVDLVVTSAMIVIFAVLFGLEEPTPSAVSATAVFGATALAYLVLARRSTGSTLGEALFRVRYP